MIVISVIVSAAHVTVPSCRMRVIVDYDKCESNGLCVSAAPTVFEVRDDDMLYVLAEHPEVAVHEQVRRAARLCPKQAITLED